MTPKVPTDTPSDTPAIETVKPVIVDKLKPPIKSTPVIARNPIPAMIPIVYKILADTPAPVR